MKADWLIKNAGESRGFISQRVRIVTYHAIFLLFGKSIIKDHGRTDEGVPICQILAPLQLYDNEYLRTK